MKVDFRTRIIELMESKDINQSELSRRTGITQSSLSDYIKGKYSPKQDKIDLIAKALGTTPAHLMGWDGDDDAHVYTTVAAHATDDLTPDEMKQVLDYIKFVKSQRGNND